MERHKFYVEIGEFFNGNSGSWSTNSQNQFETVVECRTISEGERMVQAQYGGNQRCRVQWRGRA
jgi:hypothetical protein